MNSILFAGKSAGYPGRLVVFAIIACMFMTGEVSGQYFGRNKVQYEEFNFRKIETEHFEIYYYPQKEEAIMNIGRMAERWYSRLSELLNHEFATRKPIVFYADDADFQQTNVIAGFIGQGTGGVTEGLKNRIVMPMTGMYSETDHVLGHEIVHVFQFDIAQRDTARFRMNQLPLWLVEGMAEYLTLGSEHPHTAMWMRDAVMRDDLPTTRQLSLDPRYFPYRFGQAFWAFVGGTYGDESVRAVYQEAGRGGLDSAFINVLGITADSLTSAWHQATRELYEPALEGRTAPEDIGVPILSRDIDAGRMNLGPSMSPDGRYVAFLSERDLFGIDLFLADAQTGNVIRRLVSAESDPHFDALRFINSAGAWSPDGERFAFVVFQEGENRIALLDVERRRITERIRVPNVGTIINLSWSSDGRTIAFSGMHGGISNLYTIDVETREVNVLTSDHHSVLHPAWSPDGETIAYVTDDVEGTDFGQLVYAGPAVVLYNVADGSIRRLDLFEDAVHTNPQFSPDGSELYFVANPDGFSNVYRVNLETGSITQLTNVATGTTGITLLAPALTVASQSGEIMVSVFENGAYNVYRLDEETDIPETEPVAGGGTLPPVERPAVSMVETYLADPLAGLPGETEFPSATYRPRLELDYVGSPGVGVATSSFGTGVVGGVNFFFSDMLGDHSISAAVQAQGTFRDVGGQAMYVNREQRLNWGVLVGRIPYLTGRAFFTGETIEVNGETVPVEVLTRRLQRIYFNELSTMASYPFSMTRRWEVSTGYSRIGYHIEDERLIFHRGAQIARERESLPTPDGLNLFQGSTALVGDNSFFGLTSPVRGERFRIQGGATFGSLQFMQLLLDYRRYFFRNPFTFAVRGLHSGRYGPDSESDRLSPEFLGWYPQYVRGYSLQSMTASEFSDMQHLLIGSRMGVINAELRVPLIGVEGYGLLIFPFLPVELSLFVDAGAVWSDGSTPILDFQRQPVDQVPIFSTGASARINILGALVMEIYYAYPFQRPERGGHFGFQLMPGW